MSVKRRAAVTFFSATLVIVVAGPVGGQDEAAPDAVTPEAAQQVATMPTTAPAADAPPAEPALPATPPNIALAEHLAGLARDVLRAPAVNDASWAAGAALLDGASRLAPDEARFPRLRAEAALRVGDAAGASAALSAYRRLRPDDQHAQVRQIDLYLGGMETADAQLQYLRDVLDAGDAVPAPVRAHAAVRAARVMFERSQPTDARGMLDEAIALNPLNPDALSMRFELLDASAPPAERVAALLQMVRSNPAQAAVMARVAREVADAGLVRPAIEWYGRAFDLHARQGITPSIPFGVDYAAQLLLSDEPAGAEALAKQLTSIFPEQGEAWFLRLLIARAGGGGGGGGGGGDAAAQEALRKQAAIAQVNRLALIRRAAGDAGATTRPIDSPAAAWPDPAADLELLAKAGRQNLVDAYAAAAADVAWLRIYFDNAPAEAAPWTAALRTLWGEQSPTVARLEGWAFLQSGKPDEARVKLSAVADRDPLAALGMVKIALAPDAKAQATAEAARLLGRYPSGLVGATIADALKSVAAKPEPSPEQQAVAAELEKFPREWLRVLDAPAQFYVLRADPVRIAHAFGEPMLLNVQVTNTGENLITVGDDGLLRPDLWVDAQLRGVAQQPLPAVAFDRLGGPLVLKRGETASQVVRVDGGQLAQLIGMNPMAAVQIQFQVTTNPTSTAQRFGPGPAGYAAKSQRLVERSGAPMESESLQRRIADTLAEGTPEQKVRTLDLVAAYAAALAGEGDAEGAQAAAQSFREFVRRATGDADPNVRAWAAYRHASLVAPPDRAAATERLAGDEHWVSRVLAAALAHEIGPGAAADVARKLAESDADPVVRAFATAAKQLPPPAPATQPATAPAPVPPPSLPSSPQR